MVSGRVGVMRMERSMMRSMCGGQLNDSKELIICFSCSTSSRQ